MKQFDTDTDAMQMSEDYKPTYINEQHNNNCQQFFGPITNCTFMMPAAPLPSKKRPNTAKPKARAEKKPSSNQKQNSSIAKEKVVHCGKGVNYRCRTNVYIT